MTGEMGIKASVFHSGNESETRNFLTDAYYHISRYYYLSFIYYLEAGVPDQLKSKCSKRIPISGLNSYLT